MRNEESIQQMKQTKFAQHMSKLDFSKSPQQSDNPPVEVPSHRKNQRISLEEYKKILEEKQWTQKDFEANGYCKHQAGFYNWLLKGKNIISKQQFEKEYVTNKTPLDKIAKKHKISREHITFLRLFYNIKRVGPKRINRAKNEKPFTDFQKQIILGSLLGDAKIEGKNLFSVKHSIKQKEYCQWLLSILKEHSNYKKVVIHSDYDERFDTNNKTCFFGLLTHSWIEKIQPKTYLSKENGKVKKTVTRW